MNNSIAVEVVGRNKDGVIHPISGQVELGDDCRISVGIDLDPNHLIHLMRGVVASMHLVNEMGIAKIVPREVFEHFVNRDVANIRAVVNACKCHRTENGDEEICFAARFYELNQAQSLGSQQHLHQVSETSGHTCFPDGFCRLANRGDE